MTLDILVTLIFVISSATVVGLYLLTAGGARADLNKQVQGRLQEMSGMVEIDGVALVKTTTHGPMPAVDRIAVETAAGSALERWLAQTGLAVSVSGLLVVSVVSSLLLGVVGGTLVGHPLATGAGALLGLAVPSAVLRQRRVTRLRQFEEHFPEALDLMSRAVRAGHAFSAGLKMASDELDDPVGSEFRKTFDEQNFGLPLADALDHLADRMPLLDVRFFVTAVLIQHETGGNLAEILDNLAQVVRERFKIRRQVRTHTAHGRMTGYVLLALPAFLTVALSFISPDHVRLLFQERMGQMMLMGSIVMQTVGFLWIRQVVKIEV